MTQRKRKNSKNNGKSLPSAFTRYMLIVAVFIFWIAAIGVRLVHLQVNQHEWLRGQALEQRSYKQKTKMLRGTIFDRSGSALAMSIKVKSLYADPTQIEDLENTAERVAEVLKINKKEILRDLTYGKENNRQFVWLARKVDEEDFQKVNKILIDSTIKKPDMPKFAGLHWKVEQKRSYPNKTLAAGVLGFTNSEHLGRAGIEMSQEEILQGKETSSVFERDRLGRIYDEVAGNIELPKDVLLTLSSSIQYKTEEALAKGAGKVRAKSGKAIVLDPKTGEILAMANFPTFDPNDYRKLKPEMWKNRVIQDNYSPGSVFKLVTYGAALEENLIEPDGWIDCGNGEITISGHKFRDSHSIGNVSYTKAFAHSSNVGAIKTGMELGKDSFYNYAKMFGFGEPTGVELPAEASGILRSPKSWNKDSLASMSIGYEIGVTALQSATAFAIIANDGIRVQPHIVKEIQQSDGKTVSMTQPAKKRVVSAETAQSLRQMLRQVVTEGTAKNAQLNGYTSAGKTGTAWKYDAQLKAINRNKYVSSFIGFAPADNPKVVIAVVMDEPQGANRNGGHVAAPVFADIAEQILPELNVTPDGTLPDDSKIEIPEAIENQTDFDTTVADTEVELKTDKEEKADVGKKQNKSEKIKKSDKQKKKEDGKEEKPTTAERKAIKDKEQKT